MPRDDPMLFVLLLYLTCRAIARSLALSMRHACFLQLLSFADALPFQLMFNTLISLLHKEEEQWLSLPGCCSIIISAVEQALK